MDHTQGMEHLRKLQGNHDSAVSVDRQPKDDPFTKAVQALQTSDPEREVRIAAAIRQDEENRAKAKFRELLIAAQVSRLHSDKVESIKQDSPWLATYSQLADRLENSEGGVFVLLGERGTGKSQMAVNLIHRACHLGVSARYVRAIDMFREFRSTFRDKGPEEIAMVQRYAKYGLLVIDEAHERGHTPYESQTLTNIVDWRYGDQKLTLMVSNDTIDTFGASVGPSIARRILETGQVIECNWKPFA